MNHQRALRQYLEDWQRSGLDSLAVQMPEPVAAPPAPAAAKPAMGPKPVQTPASAAPPARVQTRKPAVPAAPVPLIAPPRQVVETPVPRPPTPTGAKSNRSVTERVAALQVLAGACAACTKCDELASSRTQTVFGVGNPQASIMFVGEAPGADEDRVGQPFVGPAGQMLDKIIGACKMKREEVYICNVLRCRPPGNRNPTPEEAGNCREFLDGQIGIVDPDYIVCWGGVAAQNLLGVVSPVGKLRGTMHQHGRAKVVCTYHPSYLLRNPSAKKQVWEDMKFLFADMGVEL